MDQTLCTTVMAKIDEQIERTDHLAALFPENAVDWTPPIPGLEVCELLRMDHAGAP